MDNPDSPPASPTRVALDPQVRFTRREVGGRTAYIAHHQSTGKYFRLGPEEYRVASLLDGSRDLTEMMPILVRDGIKWEATEAAEFIAKLVASQLAGPVEWPSGESTTAPPAGAHRRAGDQLWSRHLPRALAFLVSQRIPLLSGHGLAVKLERYLGFLFSVVGMVYWSALVLSGLVIVVTHRQAFGDELRRMFDPGIWFVLLIMWMAAKVIHELGHAIAARYHGVRVGKIGIMFFFLAPLAYVDVTDAWKLRSRWSRVQIALAGVYLELAAAAIAAWAWWMLPDGLPRHLAAQFFLVAGPATLLVNANPLLRLDGYYVLSDLTEIPNLRMHGRAQLVGHLERMLMRIQPTRPLLTGWRRPFATFHAACSVVFQIVWMGGLIIGVSIWAKGIGVLLAAAALTLWAILPLGRWAYKIWTLDPPDGQSRSWWHLGERRRRLLLYASLLVLATEYFAATNSPLARRVPVVVQFREPQVARASSDAFVRGVYVTRGQRVKKGVILIELEDPELLMQREKTAGEWKIAQLRAIQFRRQGQLSQSAAETENAESWHRRLTLLDQQIERLSVVAERDGIVVSPMLDSLLGRFVRQGEELLRVSDPQEKELLAAVSEDDMQAYQAAASRALPTQVRLRGGIKFAATPAMLRPRARRTLPHPALAATAGGPLPVEPTTDEEGKVRLIQPHLQGRTPLDAVTSVELRSGQIGTMIISDNRTLVARLWDSLW